MLTSAKMGQYGVTKHKHKHFAKGLSIRFQRWVNHFSTVSGWGTVVDQMLMIGGKIGIFHIKTEKMFCSSRVKNNPIDLKFSQHHHIIEGAYSENVVKIGVCDVT